MRVVLYTHDMEPITIVSLEKFAIEYLNQRSRVELPVYEPIDFRADSGVPEPANLRTVRISRERFRRNGIEHMMLFTRDEESAMLLKSAFLPGQQKDVQERERSAFARGFLYALQRLGT